MKRAVRPTIAVVSLAVLAIAAIVAQTTVPASAPPRFSAFSPGPQQLSAYATIVAAEGYSLRTLVSDPELVAEVPTGRNTLLVMPAPSNPPTASHILLLERFLGAGGSLVALDSTGELNAWLSTHGAAVTPKPLLDETSVEPWFVPVKTPGQPGTFTLNATASLLLKNDRGWAPILEALATAHIDLDEDGEIDRSDPPGPHVVAAVRKMPAGGNLYVFASPAPFTNAAIDGHPEAARLASEILHSSLTAGGIVVIDESHHGWTNLERTPAHALRHARLVEDLPMLLVVPFWTGTLAAATAAIVASRSMKPFQPHVPTDPVTLPGQDRPTNMSPFQPTQPQMIIPGEQV